MARTARPKAPTASASIDSVQHRDTRLNIPTEELSDFLPEDKASPTPRLYPRDPSLDPQLVWRDKDKQDATDLAVPIAPIYIQETIEPRAIVEGLRNESRRTASASQLDLFVGLGGSSDLAERVDFYRHEQHWTNRLILGDSLMVMASLAEKERLAGQVQCIYMDPPYGIKFNSNWQVSTRKNKVDDGKIDSLTRQPEQIRAYRDTWELGIHSYLTYLRDRMTIARDLLTESGSLFVQIGEENAHLVRCLLDEVFGSVNFVSQIVFQTTSGFETDTIGSVASYLLWYARDKAAVKIRQLFEPQPIKLGEGNATWLLLPDGTYRGVTAAEKRGDVAIPDGARPYFPDNMQSQDPPKEPQPFAFEGKIYHPNQGSHWKANYPGGMEKLAQAGRIHVAKNSLRYRRFADDFSYTARGNIWTDTLTGNFTDKKIYVVQTGTKVVERCLLMTSDPGDLILDPTCGSGTTASVAEQWGRRWITTDTSRVALALARTRLMSSRYPYYLLADSAEGMRKEVELGGTPTQNQPTNDIKQGFVYNRAPHITLGSIANNAEIRVGMTAAEIDTTIKRHTGIQRLYDQPYEDPKRVRVSGPFTVESLSPHRQIANSKKRLHAEQGIEGVTIRSTSGESFVNTALEYLKKAGVQNGIQQERLIFDRLEPFAGEHIHAEGDYTENGETRRVGVCVGPELGTVGAELVKEAAKEAMRSRPPYDLLLICGFAFDAAVSQEVKRYGRLTVLQTKINPDLWMGSDLLKKSGNGNLFMVFGEPDIDIRSQSDGQIVAEIRGVDVYDPNTGSIRSNTPDDIACWFIDTDYNEESFFVRHAYFTGANDPYSRLKHALRSEIDEAAWASLYRTASRAFPPPKTGKIAVKVINHYGDEVLKVYQVGSRSL